MPTLLLLSLFFIPLISVHEVVSFNLPRYFMRNPSMSSIVTSSSSLFMSKLETASTRRELCTSAVKQFATLSILISPLAAQSSPSSYPTEASDKQKIVQGYLRLQYLLDHWEEETTICKSNVDNPYIPCLRTPEKVMEYLGYKSMKDPLFRADKTMMRLRNLVPSGEENNYLDAMEKFNEKAEEGNGMAYVSSWGEANPGGGKDRVEYYIERSKGNVIDARDSLATIIRILRLNTEEAHNSI